MRYIRPAVTLVGLMTLGLGVLYPLVITGVAQVVFPAQAAGSLLHKGPTLIGSKLIGQHFSEPKYFWGRPSATTPQPNNGAASGGSNFGPLNPALLDQVDMNIKALREASAQESTPVPVDLVTASASALDPHISVAAAHYQAGRVARARGMDPAAVEAIISGLQSGPLFDIIGEPRINVLELNMALDGAKDE